MRWQAFEVSPEWPLECVVCESLIPDEDAELDEEAYILDAYDTPNEETQEFGKAFEMPDPLADFLTCRKCLRRYGSLDKDSDPMEWLETYLEEDSKLISRQQALRMLGGWT